MPIKVSPEFAAALRNLAGVAVQEIERVGAKAFMRGVDSVLEDIGDFSEEVVHRTRKGRKKIAKLTDRPRRRREEDD